MTFNNFEFKLVIHENTFERRISDNVGRGTPCNA